MKKNITYQNILDAVKVDLRWKCIAFAFVCQKRKKSLKINDMCPVLEEYNKPRENRKKEVVKIKKKSIRDCNREKQQNQKFVL